MKIEDRFLEILHGIEKDIAYNSKMERILCMPDQIEISLRLTDMAVRLEEAERTHPARTSFSEDDKASLDFLVKEFNDLIIPSIQIGRKEEVMQRWDTVLSSEAVTPLVRRLVSNDEILSTLYDYWNAPSGHEVCHLAAAYFNVIKSRLSGFLSE